MPNLAPSRLAAVVEDEFLIRMQVADALRDQGWEVLEFASGDTAIAFLSQGRKIHFLLTDIRLPSSANGWDVAIAYHRAWSEITIVYCSGNAADDVKRVPNGLFLPKPCRLDLILEASRAATG